MQPKEVKLVGNHTWYNNRDTKSGNNICIEMLKASRRIRVPNHKKVDILSDKLMYCYDYNKEDGHGSEILRAMGQNEPFHWEWNDEIAKWFEELTRDTIENCRVVSIRKAKYGVSFLVIRPFESNPGLIVPNEFNEIKPAHIGYLVFIFMIKNKKTLESEFEEQTKKALEQGKKKPIKKKEGVPQLVSAFVQTKEKAEQLLSELNLTKDAFLYRP